MHGPHFVYSSTDVNLVSEYPLSEKLKNTQERWKMKKLRLPFLRSVVGHSCVYSNFLFCTLQVYHFSATGLWRLLGDRQALRAWWVLKKGRTFCLVVVPRRRRRPWRGQNSLFLRGSKMVGLVSIAVAVVEIPKRKERLISFFEVYGGVVSQIWPVLTWRPKP